MVWYLLFITISILFYHSILKVVLRLWKLKRKYKNLIEVDFFPMVGIARLFNAKVDDVAQNIYYKF